MAGSACGQIDLDTNRQWKRAVKTGHDSLLKKKLLALIKYRFQMVFNLKSSI